MAISRAYIIRAPWPQVEAAKLELVSHDRFAMNNCFQNNASGDLAVVFYSELTDIKGFGFEQVAALVTEHKGPVLPLSAFRDVRTFSQWPANFAIIEVA